MVLLQILRIVSLPFRACMREDFSGFPELDPFTKPMLRNKIVSLPALCSLVSRIRTRRS